MARTKKQELINNEVQDIQVAEKENAVAEVTEVVEVIEKEEEFRPVVKEEPAKKEISKVEVKKEVPTYNPWWRF